MKHLKYAKERQQFGKPIAEFQAISFKLAEMATKIEAAELLTRQAADLKIKGEKMTTEAAMAKYYASEICVQAARTKQFKFMVATDLLKIFQLRNFLETVSCVPSARVLLKSKN